LNGRDTTARRCCEQSGAGGGVAAIAAWPWTGPELRPLAARKCAQSASPVGLHDPFVLTIAKMPKGHW